MKLTDLLNIFTNSKSDNLDATYKAKVKEITDTFMSSIDELNETISIYLKDIIELKKIENKTPEQLAEFTNALRALEDARKELKIENELKTQLISIAENELKNSKNKVEQLNPLKGKFKDLFGTEVTSKITTMKDLLSGTFAGLEKAAKLAASQILNLNDRLIQFQRRTSGTLQPNALGFDKFGNNLIGNQSLQSITTSNGVSIDEFLNSISNFSDGEIFGGTNIKTQTEDLQKYGVEVAKLSHFYGINSESTKILSKVLTQQYGYSIKDTTNILKTGAKTAQMAGLNMGVFFDNLAAIADLQGDMFIAGGAEGLEKSAKLLTQLGLSARSLTKFSDGYQDLIGLTEKANRASALGFNDLAASTNKLFALNQSGEKGEGLFTEIASAAEGIKNLGYFNGKQINTSGIDALKALGFDSEQVKATQRLLNEERSLGISISKRLAKNLSSDEEGRLKAFQQSEMTITEKFDSMLSKVMEVFVDPLAKVASPVFSAILDTVITGFRLLSWALKPVLTVLNVFVKPLQWAASKIELFSQKIDGMLTTLGFNGESVIAKTLQTILGTITAWYIFSRTSYGKNKNQGSGQNYDDFNLKRGKKNGKNKSQNYRGFNLKGVKNFGKNKLSGLKGLSKRLGSAKGLGLIGSGLSVLGLVTDLMGDSSPQEKVKSAAGSLGGFGGGLLGGAALGSILGPIGTIGGGLAGALLGEQALNGIYDWLTNGGLQSTIKDANKEVDKDIQLRNITSSTSSSYSKIKDIMNTKIIDSNQRFLKQQKENAPKEPVIINVNTKTSILGSGAKTAFMNRN